MAAEPFTILSRAGKDQSQRVLQVSGPLTSATSFTFLEHVRVETAPIVILDMTGVEHVDSNGVGALAKVHMSFERENRQLAVAGLTPKVQRILEVTRVLTVLTVFATGPEAEDSLVSDAGDAGPVIRSNP
jgi:anti-anti-sigma factor